VQYRQSGTARWPWLVLAPLHQDFDGEAEVERLAGPAGDGLPKVWPSGLTKRNGP
jgi:hypothetical protein